MTQVRSNQAPLPAGSAPSLCVMQEAEKAYEDAINALLLPSEPAERERLVFSLGYLAGKDAVITRLANKSAPFSSQ